jgi:hypothetical protein
MLRRCDLNGSRRSLGLGLGLHRANSAGSGGIVGGRAEAVVGSGGRQDERCHGTILERRYRTIYLFVHAFSGW